MSNFRLVKSKANIVKSFEEYYNLIRTNVQFSGSDIKVIAISSVQAGEGKTTTSTNLAISFANAGFKTLLIDADVRNSIMSGTFRADENYEGLSSYLSGNSNLSDTISSTNIANLMLIPSGKVPPNPTSILQSKQFDNMIEVVRDLFDYVIIDTPPIGLVIDAAIIAKNCDGSILVAASGDTKRRFLQKAKEQLTQSGSPFLGVVLNKVDYKKETYGSYGTYGAYGSYGKDKAQKKSKKHKK